MDDRFLVFNHGYIPGFQQHRARQAPRQPAPRHPEPQILKCPAIKMDTPKKQQ